VKRREEVRGGEVEGMDGTDGGIGELFVLVRDFGYWIGY
jgi:hypothetical protein